MAQVTKKVTAAGATVITTSATAPATAPATATVNPMLAIIASMTATTATATATDDPLAKARNTFALAMGDADKASQGFANTYAAALNAAMPEEWYLIKPASDKSPEGIKVRREQKACYAALKGAGHSNPSVAWSQVCKAAVKLAVGSVEETEEEKAANKKTVYEKIQANLASIITKLGNCDADHAPEIKALALIVKALPVK
jgi:hypothetical protein